MVMPGSSGRGPCIKAKGKLSCPSSSSQFRLDFTKTEIEGRGLLLAQAAGRAHSQTDSSSECSDLDKIENLGEVGVWIEYKTPEARIVSCTEGFRYIGGPLSSCGSFSFYSCIDNQAEFRKWYQRAGNSLASGREPQCKSTLGHPGGSWYTASRDHALALATKNQRKPPKT